MSIAIHGLGVSRGYAIGRARLLKRYRPDITERILAPDEVESEVTRFRHAVSRAARELKGIRDQIPASTTADITSFIDAHLLMLDDYSLMQAPVELIRTRQCNAEWALMIQRDALVRVFDEMEDPYLRTRKDDIDHVVNRIQRLLLPETDELPITGTSSLEKAIIVADDLTPADTLVMHHEGIAGYVTEYGGPVSHTAILARSLGLPAIVSMRNITSLVHPGEQLIIDGQRGILIAGADDQTIRFYRDCQLREQDRIEALAELREESPETLDGRQISLQANIEFPGDVSAVHQAAASAVGLYRTEFLFINRNNIPDEEEQFQAYRQVVEGLNGIPLTLRTLDLGADKQLGGVCPVVPASNNPALGLRAIRLCLREPDLFIPQLRAILRASALGPVRLMLPMLSSLAELHQALNLIDQVRADLDAEGIPHAPKVPVGGMIEVPAAAISAHLFARHLDFLSIGTNDLVQYTLAIDRIDDEVGHLYDPMHPAVLSLLSHIIASGRQTGTQIVMCGEMAGNPLYTRLLLGLGLTEFSMHPSTILEIKRIIRSTRASDLPPHVESILQASEPTEIQHHLALLNQDLHF